MNDTSREIFRKTLAHIDGAYALNTIRAYEADMEEFLRYCEVKGLEALPSTPAVVAEFLASVTGVGIKSATIRRKISSISAIHRLSNLADPTKHSEVKIALRKMHRQLGRNFAQAYGITQPVLEKLLLATGDGLRGKRDRLLLLLAHDTLRRRCELVSLRVDDIDASAEEGACILLRRSKTDQEGTGKWLYLSLRTSKALQEWLDAAQITDGFVLRGVPGRHKVKGQLCEGQVSRIYKRLALAAGLNAAIVKTISGHSLRVGGAQDLLVKGASLPQIMVKGGWMKTDTVMRYVDRAQFRIAA